MDWAVGCKVRFQGRGGNASGQMQFLDVEGAAYLLVEVVPTVVRRRPVRWVCLIHFLRHVYRFHKMDKLIVLVYFLQRHSLR